MAQTAHHAILISSSTAVTTKTYTIAPMLFHHRSQPILIWSRPRP